MSADETPSWLNREFLEKVLGEAVVSFEATPLGNPNEFFTSSIHRVKVELKSGKREHVVVKKLTDREGDGKLMAQSSMFNREIHGYEVVLPKLAALLEKAYPGMEPLSSRYFYSSTGILVLEDLTASGFRTLDRLIGLDLDHSLEVMRVLAKFHGASVILYQEEPQCFQPFLDTIFAEDPVIKLQKSFFLGMTKLLTDEIENWPGFGERYSKKLKELAPKMQQLAVDGARRQEGRFNVLTHDDIWINNMMFNPEGRVRLIDFQMLHYASPGNDFQLFFGSSLTDEVRRNHRPTLFKEYHKVLCETLNRLGYKEKLVTIEELQEEYRRSALYGFVLNVIFLPGVLARPDCEIPMFEVNGAAPSADIYEKSRIRTVMAELLKEFEKQGAFSID